MVINQAPQTKNCRKLITISLSLTDMKQHLKWRLYFSCFYFISYFSRRFILLVVDGFLKGFFELLDGEFCVGGRHVFSRVYIGRCLYVILCISRFVISDVFQIL